MKPKVFFTKKITPEKVVELYDALGIDLPGKVAVLKGELEARLPNWRIVVGTTEAIQLVRFLREFK